MNKQQCLQLAQLVESNFNKWRDANEDFHEQLEALLETDVNITIFETPDSVTISHCGCERLLRNFVLNARDELKLPIHVNGVATLRKFTTDHYVLELVWREE